MVTIIGVILHSAERASKGCKKIINTHPERTALQCHFSFC